MYKNFKLFTPIIILLMALAVVLTGLTLTVNTWLFLLCVILSVVVFGVVILLLTRANRKVGKTLSAIADGVLYANSDAFSDTSVPTIVVYEGGEIIWYNESCKNSIFTETDTRGEHIAEFFPTLDFTVSSDDRGENVEYNNRKYTVFVTTGHREGHDVSVLYLVDDTVLKDTTYEYFQSRPSVALVLVDSYEELLQDFKDIERAKIMGAIEDEVRAFFAEHHGFIVRTEKDKFLVIVEERGVQKIIEHKFNLLDKVRNLEFVERMTATLSIGLGRGADTLAASQEMASQALEMCLGRGGDQAAIRTQDGYQFYGGVSTGVEKRTKVKTRIIASALAELIEASANVIIMGHRFADLDALGSAVGMLKATREITPNSFICIDQEKNLVIPLLDHLKKGGYTNKDFIAPKQAMKHVNNNTLLIVVDVHVPNVLESEELYRACKNVVVIDHHRKLVNYISNAVIFYHEPHASSASEMVTELIQYFPKSPNIGKLEAEALLAGITLDTKNFVMRTGARTFEAAAWLRRMGADTIEVKKLFASSMESYLQKSNIVSSAKVYKNCAIAYTEEQFDGVRIAASQAADDLMNISGVNASFVLFVYDDVINVSARSMGDMNVQVIMESLGGGGHLTMAAAQFPGETIANIMDLVKGAIDVFYESLSEENRKKLYEPEVLTATIEDIPDEGTILEGQHLEDIKASSMESSDTSN